MNVDTTRSHMMPLRVAPVVGVHLKSTLLPRLESETRVVEQRYDDRWLVLTTYWPMYL